MSGVLAGLIGSALPPSGPIRYFIFQPDAIRGIAGGGDPLVQLSEFNLMVGGNRITSANYGGWNRSFSPAASIGGAESPGNETPGMANDGSTNTKWLDFRGIQGGLLIDIGEQTLPNSYRWFTANDGDWRDPISWRVWASRSLSSGWQLVSTVTNASITNSRLTLAGTWSITYP